MQIFYFVKLILCLLTVDAYKKTIHSCIQCKTVRRKKVVDASCCCCMIFYRIMDPTKLTIEHPFLIEKEFKKTDLEKMMATKDGISKDSIYFAYKEGGVVYQMVCKLKDIPNAKMGFYLYVFLGNVKEIKATFCVSLAPINYSADFEHVFTKPFSGKGMKVPENMYSKPGFFDDNDKLIVRIDGTLIFDRPLILTTSFPIDLRWNIKESELKSKSKLTNSTTLLTEKFKVSSISTSQYRLALTLNKTTEYAYGNVEVCLDVEKEKDERIEAYFTLTINSNNYECFWNGECRFDICSIDELFHPSKDFFVNGEMTLEVNGNLIIRKEEPSFKLSGLSIKGFKNKKDFKIVVDGKDIPVHKSLLIESSKKFASTINSIFKRKTVIFGFSFKTVDAAVQLLYGISPPLFFEDLIPLLHFTNEYTITDIKALIENHLIKNILESNVCQLIYFSSLFQAPHLNQKSREFLHHCLKTSTPVNDLDLLDKDLCLQLLFKSFSRTCNS